MSDMQHIPFMFSFALNIIAISGKFVVYVKYISAFNDIINKCKFQL